jgi:hypothetical protein
MAVHAIRIEAEKPLNTSIEQIRQAVNDWVADHTEVLKTERSELSLDGEEILDGDPLVYGFHRFAYSDSKQALLDELESTLQQYVAWYRLKYHACPHDEADPDHCSTDQVLEYGVVPSVL